MLYVSVPDASQQQVEEAVTSEKQWYLSYEGMDRLLLLFQYFQQAGFAIGMFRDTGTQDMQFGFSGAWPLLRFSCQFSEGNADNPCSRWFTL
jgi:hypothetical protein